MCDKCGGTGLIPFHNRKDTWVHCDCYESEQELYHPAGDFDFPCSDTFRGYSFEIAGKYDLGITPEPTEVNVIDYLETDSPEVDRKLKLMSDTMNGFIKRFYKESKAKIKSDYD